jgi:hypothetical protein
MLTKHLFVAIAFFGFTSSQLVSQQAASTSLQPPSVTSGKDGIFAAFQTHSVVALGDVHGMAQEEDFFAELIRDLRFAKEVGNVVVEFGDATEQETIDRYVAGEDIPYQQLRRVWANTAGWFPTVTALGYMNFFAEVRIVNLTLPSTQRIHVWLGDPPIDWSKVKTRSDLAHVADRDQYPAELITSNLLAKNKKTLVIYGVGHMSGPKSLVTLVEKTYPGSVFVVTPYFGFVQRSCSEAFESKVQAWPSPALATPVRNSSLQGELQATGCHFVDASDFRFDKTATEAQIAAEIARTDGQVSGILGDALLYLAPAVSLTQSPLSPDLYLDLEFRKEIGRRFQIITGEPMEWPTASDNPMSPHFVRAYGQALSSPK